ncbi:MAG: endonuclease [Pseudobdellovibrio sp.]
MKFLLLSFVVLGYSFSYSQELPLYYGNDFLQGYQDHSLTNTELKNQLFLVLSGGHVKNVHTPDSIVANCNSVTQQEIGERPMTESIEADTSKKCVEHRALGYDSARRKMFGTLHLKTLDSGVFSVTDVYCERQYTDKDFGGSPTFGPDMIPSSGNIINTEHTWPQSRFTGRFNREMQKSDLHHLFPTDSEMNSRRGSLRFGVVAHEVEKLKCPQNHLGQQAEGGIIFEPPTQHKGNIARAHFYFATRYQMKISPSEEAYLRKWNVDDPVDAEEFERNNKVESFQGNRNPFIDFPTLVDRIDTFNN